MNRTPILLKFTRGSCLVNGRTVVFLLIAGSGGFIVVVILFPAVAGVVPLFSAIQAGRCFRRLGYATIVDLGTAVAQTIIQVKMVHHALHLINAEFWVAVRSQFDVLIIGCKPLNTGVSLNLPSETCESFRRKIGIRVLSVLRIRADELIHFCIDDVVSNFFVFVNQLLHWFLSVTAYTLRIVMLEHDLSTRKDASFSVIKNGSREGICLPSRMPRFLVQVPVLLALQEEM